jgi:ATP-dependent DNA ligase
VDHIEARGRDLFRACAERDLEGIVAKWHRGTYRTDGRASSWLKIKNAAYLQMEGRRELFNVSRRHETRTHQSTPDLRLE